MSFLLAWHSFLLPKKSNRSKPSCSDAATAGPSSEEANSQGSQYTYTDLLKLSIPGNAFAISEEDTIRADIHKSLGTLAGKVSGEYGKAKGRKRQELNLKVKRFHIFEGQTASIVEMRKENEMIKDELEEWKAMNKNLQSEVEQLYQEMQAAIQERDHIISDLKSRNQELMSYIETLENSANLLNKGKDISEVKKKSRTLNTFLSRAKTALWFSRSFGLELKSLTLNEAKTGASHTVMVTGQESTASSLSEEEKANVEKVLFLLDKFCVGDSFYHELTMVMDGLPKSYLVKQRRDQLNDICHITSTPGEAEGAQMSFTDLLKQRLKDFVVSHPGVNHGETVQVKISGDGARMTRNSSYIIMSFALLQLGDDVMAAKGNHTIAVVKGKEDYNTLQKCFGDVFRDINTVISEKKIEVNGTTINLEFFLGGDYKFILLMMGLRGATSHYACAWCKIHKSERWNMNYNLEHYNSPGLMRTLHCVKRHVYGCRYSRKRTRILQEYDDIREYSRTEHSVCHGVSDSVYFGIRTLFPYQGISGT